VADDPTRSVFDDLDIGRTYAEDEIVDALVALGIDEDGAREAVRAQEVPLLLLREAIGEGRPYSLEQVAERSGMDLVALRRIFMALGTPFGDRYSEGDVDEARRLNELLGTFSLDTLVRLARVRGMSVRRIAMGDADAIRDELVAPLRERGADDLTIAVSLAESARALHPLSVDLLIHAYDRALYHVLSSQVVSAATQRPGQEQELAVGFVDLVGYTALSARVDPTGLEQVLEAFEGRVLTVAGSTEDVQLVKFLGDAAMFVATAPTVLARTLLRLVEPVEELEEAPIRAGMAAGETLSREGDYFGPAVNLAARLTDRAHAWRLLAADDLEDELSGTLRTQRVRPMRIRGVGLRRPVAVSAGDGDGG
jgi:adenylate cyclase